MTNEVASIGVGVETGGIEQGIKSLKVLADQGPRVEKAMAGVEGAAVKTGKSLKSIAEGAGKGLDEVGKTAPKAADGVGRVAKSADDAKKAMSAMNASAAGLSQVSTAAEHSARSMTSLNSSMQSSQKSLLSLQSQVRSASDMSSVVSEAVRASSAIDRMATSTRVSIKNTEDLRRALDSLNGVEEKYIRSLMQEASMIGMGSGARAAYIAQTRGMSESTQALAHALGSKTEALKDAQKGALSASDAFGILRGAMAAMASIGAAKQLASMADTMTNMESRLKLVTNGTDALSAAQSSLFLIAQNSRVRFADLADTYAQMARSTNELGVSQKDMLAVTQTISQAMTISGGSAASVNAALVQLSQGFASGTLRGEELNSVMEQTPRLAQAIAQGLGVGIGELRKMGSEGELTAQKVVDALQKAAPAVAAEFRQMSVTIEQSMTTVGNSLVNIVGTLDKLSGASSSAAHGVLGFSANLDALDAQIKTMAKANGLSDFFFAAFNSDKSLNDELGVSRKELDELKTRLEKYPNNIYLRSATADAQQLVNKLVEAQNRLNALNGGDPNARTGGIDVGSFPTRGSHSKYEKEFNAAQQALLGVTARNEGFSKQFIDDLNVYEKALKTGAMSASEYADAVTKLNTKRYESSEAGKEEAKALRSGASEAKAAENSYQGLLKSVNEHIAAVRLQMDGSSKLTESQKLQIKYDELLANGKKGASAATMVLLQSQISALAVLECEQKALKLNVAAYQDYVAQQKELSDDYVKRSKTMESALLAMDANEETARQEFDRLKLESSLIGASNQARAVALAQYDAQIELERELWRIRNLDTPNGEKGRDELRERARALSAKKVAIAERKAYVAEWEKTSQLIGSTLSDYIMGGGKDAAQYLKRLFATLVLQPVVQYGVSGAMGAMGFGGNPAAGGGAASNTLGLLQSGHGLWSAFSGGTAGTLASGVVGLGQLMGSSFLGELGAGIAAGGQLGIGGTASLIGSAGGTTGAGMVLGAALPWVAGGLAIASLLGGVSFGSRGANHSGGAYSTLGNGAYDLGFGGHALQDFTSRGNAEIAASVKTLVTSTVSAFDYLGKYANDTFKGVDIAAGFAVNGRYSDEDAYAYFSLRDKATGDLLESYKRRDGGLGSDPNAAWSQFSADLLTAVYGQFMKADLTGWVRDEMVAIDGKVTFENLAAAAQKIATIDTAFTGWGKTIDGMLDLSGSVQTTLLRVSGGFDALAAGVNSFYAGYYSEAERAEDQTNALAEVFAKYGAALPATREQYRALVEQQLAAGDAGAEFAAVLLGLNQQFGSVADYWAKELGSMSTSVVDFFADLKGGISALSSDVESSRRDILRGTAVMSASEIEKAIAGTAIVVPGLSAVDATGAVVDTAMVRAQQQKATADAAKAAEDAQGEKLGAAKKERDSVASQISAIDSQIASLRSQSAGFGGRARIRDAIAANEAQRAKFLAQLEPLEAAVAQQQAAYDGLASASKDAAEKLAQAQKSLADATKANDLAKADYAAEVGKWVNEAGNSVSKLSELRGEVVSFYEAQAQAVQGMLQSAGNLRSVVDQVRLGQLTTAQTAAELGSRYAMDYSMAMATTGAARAGYVDSMAGNLQGLSEALKAEATTGADWRIQTAKLLAQASNAAGLLEGDAKDDDYKDVALGLLGNIDSALANLSGSTKSAEQVIADAINSGTHAQLDGLRAIVAALKGEAVPAFAAGGFHAGGLRIVGENGPELEATGPSRIWTAQQTRAMFSGNGSMDALVSELRMLREENQAQALAIVSQQEQLNRLMMRWETQGMPEERDTV
ncbi:MAG: tape measure protein [Comamonas sp.]|jgi:tape measure domain-containing protein|uniref:tape measure protein n=1 Tax=Comamonas sp. TaxID=34028 RepID=UPI00281BF7F2|nr:tape measure protein [Comamonas sp.]MDR0216205.1 tape measure protein [Comamonas sp.]